MWDVVKDNRGFVLGVVVPVLLILRFPPLIPWALRLVLGGSQVLLLLLIRTNNVASGTMTLR